MKFYRRFAKKFKKLNIGVVPKNGEILYCHLCKWKKKKEEDEHKDVIYNVP